MDFRAFWAVCLACLPSLLQAATTAVPVTPSHVGVLGGDSYTFTARFFDAAGRPAANENVQFLNDACGSFSNGASVMTVRTDANGTASAAFTARNQGITCWVSAAAGAQVRWNVVTFPIGLVHFQTAMTPPQPRPGEPFVLSVVPMAGAYRIYEGDVTARVISGTASASVANPAANSGQTGSVAFNVVPDHRVGDYELEVAYRGKTHRVAVTAPELPWQDMWWGGAAESGWGVSVVQHRDTLFSTIYGYDAAGAPTWWVMPGGEWNASKTVYSGALYQPRGPSYDDYDAADLVVGPAAGYATLTIVDGGHLALDYSIGSSTGRKSLARQPYAPVDMAATNGYADMWWGGAAQNGWGIAMLQQYQTLFAVWFTYDAAGKATWFVMPAGFWSNATTYEGRIYRGSGAPFLGAAYDSRLFKATDVGSFRLRFGVAGATSDTATFDYTIAGRSGTMPLSRQPF